MGTPASIGQLVRRFLQTRRKEDPRYKRILSALKDVTPLTRSTAAEILTLESHLVKRRRFRDRMLLIVGTTVGYRITELLTWTVGQVLTGDSDIVREITVTRARLNGGSGVHKRTFRSLRVVLNERARGAIRDYVTSLARPPASDGFLFQSREGENWPLHRSQAHRILKIWVVLAA